MILDLQSSSMNFLDLELDHKLRIVKGMTDGRPYLQGSSTLRTILSVLVTADPSRGSSIYLRVQGFRNGSSRIQIFASVGEIYEPHL